MFGITLPAFTPKKIAFLSVLALAGCGGANACCNVPPNVNKIGGVIPPGTGTPIVPTVPVGTIGTGGGGVGIPVIGTGPFTAAGCPGIVNVTVNGNIVTIIGVGAGTCVIVITGPNGAQGTITITVIASPALVATPGTIGLLLGGTGGFLVSGPGPITAVGCAGIVNATVTGNVVSLVAVGVGVCAVVVTGPGGIQTIVDTTVSASTPLAASPGTITLGLGGTGAITVAGTGPFTATGCPGIITATVNGNVVNLAAVGVGICVVVITDANGITTTVVATVTASTPLVVTPTAINLGVGGVGSIVVSGSGPFTATGCPGIINATVSGNIVNLAGIGVGVCVIVITGPNGVQAAVVGTVSATAPIALAPTSVTLGAGGTATVTITGAGPFTSTGCPGIVNALVTGNVLNLAAVGVGVCAVVATGPGGVQATVLTTVIASTALVATPAAVSLTLLSPTVLVTITGPGPFTAAACPGIVSATVSGNIVALNRLGIGVCAVVITGAGGVQTTVLVTST